MPALDVASLVVFARTLLTLCRSRATGVLEVRTGEGHWADIAVLDGTPNAAVLLDCRHGPSGLAREGPPPAVSSPPSSVMVPVLGVLMRERGLLGAMPASLAAREPHRSNAEASVNAGLTSCPPHAEGTLGLIGHRLVAQGMASQGAVIAGLRSQLEMRLCWIATWSHPSFHFESGAAFVGIPGNLEPLSTPNLVMRLLRPVMTEKVSAGDASWSPSQGGPMELTAVGACLAEATERWPEEEAIFALGCAGVPLADCLDLVGRRPRALAFVRMLDALQAFRAMDTSVSMYPLLVRKLGELRREVPAGQLLGVTDSADLLARRKRLRRWARSLHPDLLAHSSLGDVASRASGEVMAALNHADQRLADQESWESRRGE